MGSAGPPAEAQMPFRLQVPCWPALNEGFKYSDVILGRKGGAGGYTGALHSRCAVLFGHGSSQCPFCEHAPAGLTVLQFYVQRHGESCSEAEWTERISRGCVLVNGEVAAADRVLRCAWGQCTSAHTPA